MQQARGYGLSELEISNSTAAAVSRQGLSHTAVLHMYCFFFFLLFISILLITINIILIILLLIIIYIIIIMTSIIIIVIIISSSSQPRLQSAPTSRDGGKPKALKTIAKKGGYKARRAGSGVQGSPVLRL